VSEFPPGWTATTIGDLGELRLGKMLDKAKNRGLPAKYLRNINVRWFRFDLDDMHTIFASAEEMKLLSVENGDLFVCEGGEPGRCAVWRGGDNVFVYQKALHRFRSSGAMVPEFLMYRLRHDAETRALADAFTGTTIKHLTRESLARFKVPVPPLFEQKRIADKLSAVLARADACRERLDHVPAILNRFRQSVLAAATSGKLTEEWQGHRSFGLRPLGAVAKWSSGGTPSRSRPEFFGGAIPWVKTGELRENTIVETEETLTQAGLENSSAKLFPKDTILLAMYGATIGRVARLGVEATTNQACAAAVVHPNVIRPQYLFYALQAEKTALIAMGQGGAQPNISQGLIKDHNVPVPSLGEQDEIVRRVKALFDYADRLEARYAAAFSRVERLTPAFLAKAFRGELVLLRGQH
jgi:type I restriction enzyme S subunit